jgi:hypothetical protein
VASFGRLLATCGLAAALLAGCSSDDNKATTAPTTAGTTAAAGPTTTVRPVDTSFTGQNSGQFCDLAKTYNDRFAKVGAATTPAQLKTVSQDARNAISQAAAVAPSEIKNDATIVSNGFSSLFTELDKANYDVTKVSPGAFGALQSPEFQTASIRLQAYLANVCRAG